MTHVTDFMLDYETMGSAPEGATIDLAATCFKNDPHNPPTFKELVENGVRAKFSLIDQKPTGNFPRVFDQGTIEWWKNQSEEARLNLRPTPNDLSVEDGLMKVLNHLKDQGVDAWQSQGWCRGMSFDFGILLDQIRQVYKTRETFHLEPCKFWNQRDVRTAIESTLMVRGMTECPLPAGTLDGFVAHDSIHDCARDILMLIYSQRYALGLEEAPTEENADPHSVKKKRK